MLKFNNKLLTPIGSRPYGAYRVNKRAAFYPRLFFAAAAFFVLFNIFGTEFAFAQGVETLRTSGLDNTAGLEDISNTINLPQTDIRIFIARLINIALSFLGIILLGLVVYGGWLWMTSEGEPEKINQAKAILKNAAIGLVIILSAFAIVNFILRALLGGGGGGGAGQPELTYDVGVAALGDGIIESHYPARGQTDVPRNTIIIITFKEALAPDTICDISQNTDTTKCDGDALRTANIAIFTTANGAELREDADDAVNNSKVVPAKVQSTDNKTFIFRPEQFLGSQNQEKWYGVRLFGDKLKKLNGGDVSLGIVNYYQWKFQVSTRLDLTPPQVDSVFPLPDNQQDQAVADAAAVAAKGQIEVRSQPKIYAPSLITIPDANDGSNAIKLNHSSTGIYNCNGEGDVTLQIATVADINGRLGAIITTNVRGFKAVDDVTDKIIDLGCGVQLIRTDGGNFSSLATNNQIRIHVKPEIQADTLTIGDRNYAFGNGAGEIKIDSEEEKTAVNIVSSINAANSLVPVRTGNQSDIIVVTAKIAGAAGNNIALSTSNPGALSITAMHGGADRQENIRIVGQPDEPRNAIIQINFNEAMNPIQLQGESDAVKSNLKVQCISSTTYACDGQDVLDDNGIKYLDGAFTISNLYKTIEFKTKTECGQNSCGEKIYCLPPTANIKVWVKAASLQTCSSSNNNQDCSGTAGGFGMYATCTAEHCVDGQSKNYPQANAANPTADGAMDAAFNSLDGNRTANAEGPVDDFNQNQPNTTRYGTTNALLGDNFTWSFWTSDKIDSNSPIIEKAESNKLLVEVDADTNTGRQVVGVSVRDPIKISFNKLMSSSSLKPGRNYPNDLYLNGRQREYFILMNFSSVPLGYWVSKVDSDASSPLDGFADKTAAVIDHTTLSGNGAYSFVAGSGAKDIYQNCYNPAKDRGAGGSQCNDNMSPGDSCCKGIKNTTEEKCYQF